MADRAHARDRTSMLWSSHSWINHYFNRSCCYCGTLIDGYCGKLNEQGTFISVPKRLQPHKQYTNTFPILKKQQVSFGISMHMTCHFDFLDNKTVASYITPTPDFNQLAQKMNDELLPCGWPRIYVN